MPSHGMDTAGGDASLGSAGRDVGKQVPAGGCRGSRMGCSCQEKSPEQPPTPAELSVLLDLRASALCQGVGREECLRFRLEPGIPTSPPKGWVFSFCKEGRRRFGHSGDVLGTGLHFILRPD